MRVEALAQRGGAVDAEEGRDGACVEAERAAGRMARAGAERRRVQLVLSIWPPPCTEASTTSARSPPARASARARRDRSSSRPRGSRSARRARDRERLAEAAAGRPRPGPRFSPSRRARAGSGPGQPSAMSAVPSVEPSSTIRTRPPGDHSSRRASSSASTRGRFASSSRAGITKIGPAQAPGAWASGRTFASKHCRDRLAQDLEVPPRRPARDVQVVELEHLVEGTSLRPRTCQRPVMPGVTSSRLRPMPSAIWSASWRTKGRGPTRLISPRSTFQIWGSSSRLRRRMNAPTRVTRGSARDLEERPVDARCGGQGLALALGAVDHRAELDDPEERPPRPTRACRKSTGPRLSSLIAIAHAISTGSSSSRDGHADQQVERSLDDPRAAREAHARQRHDRDPLDVVERRVGREDVCELRHDGDGDVAVDRLEQLVDVLARDRREGSVRISQSTRCSATMDEMSAREPRWARSPCGPVAAVADDDETVLGMAGELAGHQARAAAGTDDHGAADPHDARERPRAHGSAERRARSPARLRGR